MSKIICDVCGTTYPETATQCPICSSAKNSAEQTAAAESAQKAEAASGGYTYVKGGRFSKKNVRRRNQRGSSSSQRRSASQEEEPKNTGLIIVIVLLLLAIVAVLIYIGVKSFLPYNSNNTPDNTQDSTAGTSQTTESTTETTLPEDRIVCESLNLSPRYIEFFAEGETWTIVVERTPSDTTDGVDFTSSNPDVATVSSDGVVTAVGYGETVIVVSCGDVNQTCVVACSFGEPTEDPADTTEPVGELVFEFNTPYVDETTGYGDTSLIKQGETWKMYKNSLNVDPADITWISDDPAVCTIENGIVTAVGPGKTMVHAQYNGVTYTCLVRCKFTVTETGSDEQGGEQNQTAKYTINHEDVTIAVDETFTLTLKDADGNVLDVTWTASAANVSVDGNKITGVSSGKVEVSTTYDGVTYTCTVRVK